MWHLYAVKPVPFQRKGLAIIVKRHRLYSVKVPRLQRKGNKNLSVFNFFAKYKSTSAYYTTGYIFSALIATD